MAKEDLTLNIKADVRKATAEIKKINKTLEEFKKEQQKIAKESLNSAKSIENFTNRLTQMAHITAGLAGLDMTISKIVEVGEAFEKSISKLGAISKASSEDLAILSDKAKELGLKTQYSAKQVADAMNYEAMAGMKTNEILTATKDILDLASVGQMDLAQASDIATDTMSAFGMSADEVGKITDVMAVTITNSNTNVEQLGEAFKNVAPVAHNLGLSIEQTSAMLGVLADSGRKGGEAGTHLKIILQRLASQTKQVKDGFEKLGLSAYDSNGKLKPMTQTLNDIKAKLDTLNDEQRNEILKDLFGEEAISSANIILNNLDSMDNKLKKISNSTGEAAKIAEKMNDNLAGDKQKLNSALESLANNIYETLLPSLREATQTLTEFVTYLAEHDEEVIEITKDILELATTFYGLKKAIEVVSFLKTAKEVLQAKNNFDLIVKSVKNFTNAISLITKANPILLTLTVVISGLVMEWNHLIAAEQKQIEITDNLNKNTKQFSEVMEELYSKHLNKTTKELELTNKEQEKYKKNIDDLILSTKKQLEVAKQNNDGSNEYKNIISQLEERLKILKKAQEDINSAKILQAQKESTQNTTKQTESIKLLTEEQKKLLKEIDAQLAKEQKKNESIDDWYKHQKDTIDKVLSGTKEYYEAVEKLNDIYYEKLKTTYDKRVEDHEKIVKTLEEKEKDLTDKIVKLNEDLQNKLKKLEQDRLNTIENIEDKIHNIQTSGLSDYEKYVDKKKQAEIKLAKAKEELEKGNLEQAKKYMGQYENLITSLANIEIKENGKVKVSKEESNKVAVNGLKELEKLTNSYYDKEKQKAIELHNQKIEQLKAQLTATKSQLELEVQRLDLEKQMIELLTGQKVDIDTTSALNSIKNLDEQIKELDTQIKNPKDVVISTNDTSVTQAKQNIQGIPKQITLDVRADYTQTEEKLKQKIGEFESNPIETKITADDEEAKHTFLEVKDYVTGEEVEFDLNAKDEKAKDTFLKVKDTITGEEVSFDLNADNEKAIKKLEDVKTTAKNLKPLVDVVADTSEAMSKINSIPKVIVTKHIIKTIEEHNAGGIVGGIHKFANGGEVRENEFKRVQGRIAGYDPSDSDDVPAMLTRGEFVVKREAVKHYGDDFLYRLNNKQLPKFATGGLVEIGEVTRQKIDTSSNTFNSFDKLNIDTSSVESAIDKVRKYFDELGINVGVVNGYVLKGNSTNISTGGAGSVRVNNGNKKNIKITDNELNSIINETKQDYSKATNVIKEAERQENSYNSKVKQYEKIVESQKETIKSEDEAKKTEDKLKSLENQIKRISDYVDVTLNKKIEESSKKLENDSEKFSDYFNRLEEEKNNIENKISSSGYSDELIAKISKKYFKTELKNDYKDNYNLSELKQKYEPILDKTINYLDEVTKTKEDISNEIDSSGYDKNLIFKLGGLKDNYEDNFDINYLQNYKVKIKQTIGQISEANSIREQIEAILSNKNIDKSFIDNSYLESYDLDRLNKFKIKLNNIPLLSEDKIKSKYKITIDDYLKKWRSVYHTQSGMNEAYVMMNKNRTRPPSGSGFVYNLGIKHDRDLAKRYDNLFKSIDPRAYGESYELGDEIIELTKKDYLKEHLPKFQNGGIIALQNGGKLPGYGGGDRNLALLEDGEFVIRKEAVKNYGAEFLHSLNSIKLPKFQFGGMVDFNNLPKFNTGGEVSSGYTANINFTMPSGKSYEFNGNESAVKAFSQELRRVL